MSKTKSIIPGFGLSTGITISYISFIILIPFVSIVLIAAHMTWGAFWEAALDPRILAGYRVSFSCSAMAAVINGVFGTLLAWILVRYDFPGRKLMDGLIELPFAIPTAVAGISLSSLYSEHGWIGSLFAQFDIKLSYTAIGITIAMIFVTLPFVVRTVEPVLQHMEPEFEEAATMLGAGKGTIFFKVILPELIPALLLGSGLAFARALGEYGSVIFIAGNTPFETEIVPLLIMSKLEQFNYVGATAIAIVMLVISFALMFLINSLQVRQQKIVRGGAA